MISPCKCRWHELRQVFTAAMLICLRIFDMVIVIWAMLVRPILSRAFVCITFSSMRVVARGRTVHVRFTTLRFHAEAKPMFRRVRRTVRVTATQLRRTLRRAVGVIVRRGARWPWIGRCAHRARASLVRRRARRARTRYAGTRCETSTRTELKVRGGRARGPTAECWGRPIGWVGIGVSRGHGTVDDVVHQGRHRVHWGAGWRLGEHLDRSLESCKHIIG